MNVLVVGAGSIGIYLGALLHKHEHNVTLLGREKLRKLHDTLLIGEDVYRVPPRIYSMPKNEKYDFVFVTSKLYDLEHNLREIHTNGIQTEYLVSIQNSIVENSTYEKYTQKALFTSVSVFEGFRLLENQLVVSETKTGWKTDTSLAGKATAKLLKDAGIRCATEENLNSIKAEKTIMNCCVNALSAVKKKTFFELCNNDSTKRMMDILFDESYEVLSTEYDMRPKEELKNLFYQTIRSMKHYSSTYQDAILGKRTEISFLNGLVVSLGKRHTIETPANEDLISEFLHIYPNS